MTGKKFSLPPLAWNLSARLLLLTIGFVMLGRCYLEKQESGKAREAFEKALICDPFQQVAHKMLGDILETEGDQAGAAQHFHLLLKLDPDNRK